MFRRSGEHHSLFTRRVKVTIPDLDTSLPTGYSVTGTEGAIAMARLAKLRGLKFDLPAWRDMTHQVANYLEDRKNITRAKKGKKCIDGRYPPTIADGMLARPGGDYGYALVLAALTDPESENRRLLKLPTLTPEEAFEYVHDVVTSRGERFYMHTDFHAKDDTQIGCGHAKAPTESGDFYALFSPGRAQRLLARARQQTTIDQQTGKHTMQMERLPGDHQEQAVLYVLGENKTVHAQSADGRQMYFVYDIARDYKFMTTTLLPALADKLGLRGSLRGEFFANFLFLASYQADHSLSILAPTAPRITIDVDSYHPKVAMLEPGTEIALREKYAGETKTGLISRLPGSPFA